MKKASLSVLFPEVFINEEEATLSWKLNHGNGIQETTEKYLRPVMASYKLVSYESKSVYVSSTKYGSQKIY